MTDENLAGLFLERFREFTIDIKARQKKQGQNDFILIPCFACKS